MSVITKQDIDKARDSLFKPAADSSGYDVIWITQDQFAGLKKVFSYMEARIAEMEKLAVVWHKYPDEKPDKDGWYITSYKGQIRRHFWDSRRAVFDTNPTDIPYVENTQPTHYAEYPAPPEEE